MDKGGKRWRDLDDLSHFVKPFFLLVSFRMMWMESLRAQDLISLFKLYKLGEMLGVLSILMDTLALLEGFGGFWKL